MTRNPPVIHVDDIELKQFGDGHQFGAQLGSMTGLLGMSKLGCSLVVLEPGKRAWPFHLHYGQEELFVVLYGQGTLRYEQSQHAIRVGDVIFAPTGEGTAHQIINTSNDQLKYLAMSSREDPEVCYYPDSGKYGSYSDGSDKALTFIAHHSADVDYWQGEE